MKDEGGDNLSISSEVLSDTDSRLPWAWGLSGRSPTPGILGRRCWNLVMSGGLSTLGGGLK